MTNGDLQSLGEMLRQARETQALSIEEVESRTRIRAKYIHALESGDFGMLPSTAHAKGFLRNYAQFLQLDVEQIIQQFSELTGTGARQVTVSTSSQEPAHTTEDEAPHPGGATHATGAARPVPHEPGSPRRVTTVTPAQRSGPGKPLGLGQPQQRQTSQRQTQTSASKTENEQGLVGRIFRSNIFTIAILVIGFVAVAWWATTRLSAITGDDIASEVASTPTITESDTGELEPTATFRLTSTPEPDTGQQILDRVVLSITVEQRTWTQIIVDGESQFEGQAFEGQVLRFEGREEIFIRTGNGAGLVVNFNGQDIGALGERGEIVERFFMVNGQATPTLTASPAPTNTSVPSPTPSHTPEP